MKVSSLGAVCLWVLSTLKVVPARSLFGPSFTVIRPNGDSITQNFIQQSNTVIGRPVPLWRNSPTYYIKMAPSGSNSFGGNGYERRPSAERPYFSVPFRGNGRPTSLYQLNSQGKPISPLKPTNSPITWLTGKYFFNGKPSKVYKPAKKSATKSSATKITTIQSSSAKNSPIKHVTKNSSRNTPKSATKTRKSGGSSRRKSGETSEEKQKQRGRPRGGRRRGKLDYSLWGR